MARVRTIPRSIRLLAGLACLMAAAVPAAAYDHAAVARQARERHFVPGYERLVAAAEAQSTAVAAACDAPDETHIAAAREAFKTALIAWGRMEHIRFGPIADQNRIDAMLFWPDLRGLARRQIARVLAGQDADALSPDRLAEKSVAVRGFSALDVVLFGPGAEVLTKSGVSQQRRCAYARALAADIETMARDTLAGWADPAAGFARLWLEPGSGNPVFLTQKETTHTLVQAFLTGVRQVRNVRIGGPLGLKVPGARPMPPVVPNSGLALELVIANIEGLRALITEPGLAEAAPEGSPARSILHSVVTDFDLAIPRLRAVRATSSDPFRDDAARGQLIALGFPLRNAHDSVFSAMAEAAGLSMGFNSLDGD